MRHYTGSQRSCLEADLERVFQAYSVHGTPCRKVTESEGRRV